MLTQLIFGFGKVSNIAKTLNHILFITKRVQIV